MFFNRGFLFYKFFNIRLFFYLLFHRFDILVPNDLDTLLPNYLISRLKQLPLVYDSHEYFTGVPELNGRPFVKWVWTSVERFILPGLKNVITVSNSIAEQYKSEYNVKPLVIRNCAGNSVGIIPYSREDIEIKPDHLIVIFQGAGINTDRGGEELIEAVKRTEKVTLLIVGSGDKLGILKDKVNGSEIEQRVKFIPKVPWEELMRYTKLADVGVSLDKDTSLNYRYSLPNKLFDYISAGIPVIAGDLPEVGKIIDTYKCGILIPVITPDEISKAIVKLRDNRELLNRLKQNSISASESLNWESESEQVNALYNKVLQNF